MTRNLFSRTPRSLRTGILAAGAFALAASGTGAGMGIATGIGTALADGHVTASPKGASVYFVNLKDGATVSSPLKINFGLSGMGIAPAGIKKAGTGHHHLFIDRPPLGKGEDGADELTNAMPADDNHKHFGKGQTETTITLPPGKHTLQLVLGDHNHVPHVPPVTSKVITITVK